MTGDVVDTWADAAEHGTDPLMVLAPLQEFLDAHGLGTGPITAQPIGEGHSNVTFAVRRGDGTRLVLRRPPRGPLPPSAHDVLREARLLQSLSKTPAPVPEVLAVAPDAVIGVPFYVMPYLEGEVVTDTLPPVLATPDERRHAAEGLVDALVEIHAVDWRAAGLEHMARRTGYLERQVRRWTGLWEHNATRPVPVVAEVGRWLGEHLPRSPEATIVHGDYRLGNVMLSTAPPARVVAVLDWEMAAIGDPFADIGYLTATWTETGDPPSTFDLSPVTREAGFPTRAQLVDRYEQRSGRAVTDLRWYQTLALWKAAVFMEGNHRRATEGGTDDPYLQAFGDGVVELAERAAALAFSG